jgi:hypothetical protein
MGQLGSATVWSISPMSPAQSRHVLRQPCSVIPVTPIRASAARGVAGLIGWPGRRPGKTKPSIRPHRYRLILLTVTESLAARLPERGVAHEGPGGSATIADGSTVHERTIVIDVVSIGAHILHDVHAGVVPDDADMLLGLPLLNAIGRFTIDAANHKLIFG